MYLDYVDRQVSHQLLQQNYNFCCKVVFRASVGYWHSGTQYLIVMLGHLCGKDKREGEMCTTSPSCCSSQWIPDLYFSQDDRLLFFQASPAVPDILESVTISSRYLAHYSLFLTTSYLPLPFPLPLLSSPKLCMISSSGKGTWSPPAEATKSWGAHYEVVFWTAANG